MNDFFSIKKADGGVALIVLDAKNDKVNTLNIRFGKFLQPELNRLANDPSCTGIVIISGKADSFIAGADIDQLRTIKTESEARLLSQEAHQMLGQLAEMKVPVVAAIHGSCLGGGLELALACCGRVCTDSKETKLALPEVQLGLIPGAGGTQRLPRLIGAQAALDMILTGKSIQPKKALKMGLVNEVVAKPILKQAAIHLALKLAKKNGTKGHSTASFAAALKQLKNLVQDLEFQKLFFEGNPLGRTFMFRKAKEMVEKKTGGNYPAPFAALRAVKTGLAKGMTAGFTVEADEFGKLVVSPQSRRLVEIFYATQDIKKETGVNNPDVIPETISRIGVLGGGFMGSGIAYVTAAKGMDVRVKERDSKSGAKALGAVWDIIYARRKRKQLTRNEAEVMMSRVTATVDLSGFKHMQMVIEAVYEDLELKQCLLKEVESATDDTCVFASNTSAIPIGKIAKAAIRPEQVLGLHFFSPVHKMPLLEIIVTPKTSDQATATSVAYGKRIGKQVIVVRDGVGFYTSRILAPFLNEATIILSEGAAVNDIDNALIGWGFPVGPITLLDEVGIEIGVKVAKIMFEAFGHRMHAPESLKAVIEDGRLGRKNGRGFFKYGKHKGNDKQVDDSVYDLLPGGRNRIAIDIPVVQKRVALRMVNEAMHCFDEGILRNTRDGDIGAIFGLGFPPFRGGPFTYTDMAGAQQVVDDLNRLRGQFGDRFAPAPVLVDAAKNNCKFRDSS